MRVKKFHPRQEAVCDYIRLATIEGLSSESDFFGVDASTVSAALHLDRANVSRELNDLYREGQMIKLLGKPTLYMHRASVLQHYPGTFIPATIPKNASLDDYLRSSLPTPSPSFPQPLSEFDAQIGVSGSLKSAVDLAKAAISYPPHGLHMLIYGNSGCGKTHFVQKIHSFAISQGILQEDAPFVVFDGQDTPSSPQILQSKIFGCSKEFSQNGTRSRRGLLEQASGGILCLEGAEHLPPVIQSQLVTFFEKNTFKRFGENNFTRVGNVTVICITTEPLSSPLVERLTLNIPVHIHIPDLNDRGLDELFSYISLFFRNEASLIGKSIHVDKGVLAALLCKTYCGNVAQLHSIIQIICALAFASYSNSPETGDVLWVNSEHLPANIFHNNSPALSISAQVEALLVSLPMDYAVFSAYVLSQPQASFPRVQSPVPVTNNEQLSSLVIATYGHTSAEEQASLINSICGSQVAVGLSFSPDTPLDSILTILFDTLRQANSGKGVFLATDIVPLYRMQDYIRKQIQCPISLLSDLRLPSLLLMCGNPLREDTPAEYFSGTPLLPGDHAYQNAPVFLNRIISEILAPTLTFLNPEKAAKVLLSTLENILSDLARPYSDEIAIKFVFHCSHMLERLIRGNAYKYDHLRSFLNANSNIYTCVEKRLIYVAESFGVSLPAPEAAYVAELFVY